MKMMTGTSTLKDLLKYSFSRSLAMVLVSISFLISCTPSNNPGTSVVNNYGGDKNDPGGYGGGGTGDGGGGQGIQCSAEATNQQFKDKLFVRDIFEAIYIAKETMKNGPSQVATNPEKISSEEAQFLIQNLRRYFGHTILQMEIGDEDFWNKFVSKINFISEDAQLVPSQDANSPIALPKGCKIVQIAFWDDSRAKSEGGILYIDKKQWLRLDSINKLALLAHEYFFKEARAAGYKNSDFVRVKVGSLFSEKGLAPLLSQWGILEGNTKDELRPENLSEYKFCTGKSLEDSTATLQMYYYEGGRPIIPILKSKEISISSLENIDFATSVSSEAMSVIHYLSSIGSYRAHNVKSDELAFDINFKLRESTINLRYDNYTAAGWLNSMTQSLGYRGEFIWSEKVSSDVGIVEFNLGNPVHKVAQVEKKKLAVGPLPQLFALLVSDIPYDTTPVGSSGAAVGAAYSGYIFSPHDPMNRLPEYAFTENKDFVPLTDEQYHQEGLNLYSILNLEISSYIKKGIYPTTFPKWDDALSSLVPKIYRYNSKKIAENYKKRFASYPMLMYKAKLGILLEGEKDLIEKAFTQLTAEETAEQYDFVESKLQVSKDSKKISFNLTCVDAGVLYNKNLKSPLLGLKNEKSNSEIKINMDFSKFSGEKNEILSTVKRYLMNIANRPVRTSPQIESDGMKSYVQISLNGVGSEKLIERLEQSKEVNILPCSSFSPVLNQSGNMPKRETQSAEPTTEENSSLCIIVNPSEDKSYYMVKEGWTSKSGIEEGVQEKTINYFVRPITPPKDRPIDDFVF